jgi:hypothetical protein
MGTAVGAGIVFGREETQEGAGPEEADRPASACGRGIGEKRPVPVDLPAPDIQASQYRTVIERPPQDGKLASRPGDEVACHPHGEVRYLEVGGEAYEGIHDAVAIVVHAVAADLQGRDALPGPPAVGLAPLPARRAAGGRAGPDGPRRVAVLHAVPVRPVPSAREEAAVGAFILVIGVAVVAFLAGSTIPFPHPAGSGR